MPRPTTVLLAALGLLAAPVCAGADPGVAVSNTAMSVTGDIEVDDFSIVFANGESLVFSSLVGDSFVVGGERVPASVYEVETPGDPALENGNTLCGAGDVTYVASWSAPEIGETGFVVAVFTGDEAPASDAEMCASYTYE